jgi:NAD(P)-dependent dehydrogenase (short-subunit alcohol dehydrogenase family)
MPSVLITGTSSGFGLHTTLALARAGWQVVASMRNLDRAGPLKEALATQEGAIGSNVCLVRLDVASRPAIEAAVPEVLAAAGGRLDAVVHNAGVAVGAAFEDLPVAEIDRVMNTNFFGVLDLTRALLPGFRKQRSGRIVIVSSNSAFAGEPTNSIYCASKFAIEGWAESIAFELEPFGIHVSLIEPGPFRTSILGNSRSIRPEDSPYLPLTVAADEAFRKHFDRSAGEPAVVARTIVKALQSPRPRFRYPVGFEAHFGHHARGKLPTRVLRRIVQRYLGLHRVRL